MEEILAFSPILKSCYKAYMAKAKGVKQEKTYFDPSHYFSCFFSWKHVCRGHPLHEDADAIAESTKSVSNLLPMNRIIIQQMGKNRLNGLCWM